MSRILQLFHRHPISSCVFVLIVFAALWIGYHLLAPIRDPVLEKLRTKGFPLTLAQLDEFYATVPPGENTALTYERCFSFPLFQDPDWKDLTSRDWLPARGKGLKQEFSREFRELLRKNRAVFDTLHATCGRARYSLDLRGGPGTPVPHLVKIKLGALLLSSEAMLSAEDGNTEEAMDALLASVRLADSVAREPLLISYLVRQANLNVTMRALERVLSLNQLNEAELVRLDQCLAELETNSCLVRGLAGEVAMAMGSFSGGNNQRAFLLGSGSGLGGGSSGSVGQNLAASASMAFLKVSGILARDRRFFLRSMSERIDAAELPFPQSFAAGSAVSTNLPQGQFLIFSRMLLPGLANLPAKEARHVALIREARAAIAIERFQLAHEGRPPKDLRELVPAFLATVPEDPFNGQPLHYQRSPSGYTLYSVDSDLQDNGGLELETGTGSRPCDVVYSVLRRTNSVPAAP